VQASENPFLTAVLAAIEQAVRLKAALRHVEASGLRGAPMIPPSRWRGENSDLPWR